MPATTINHIQTYLERDGIHPEQITPDRYALSGNPQSNKVTWSDVGFLPQGPLPDDADYMGLASMAAVEQLAIPKDSGMSVLDVCAAPGMKSLYLMLSRPAIQLFANDQSEDRLKRMKGIFRAHNVRAEHITKMDGINLQRRYDGQQFDRILLDAPCSGEGIIFSGDKATLTNWSTAKVKRLQQLQIKLLKSSWELLKPDGRLVYATCTLNLNENERVIRKATGIKLTAKQTTLNPEHLEILEPNTARRILPSQNSIGFFYAVLEKSSITDQDFVNHD
jgi:16S rRNA C967 or C1407 C5-methylase (RsmB/RsmF family)